jgi:sugar phosphate isomerase/epimerase
MAYAFSLAYLTVFGTPPPRMIEIAARTGYDAVGLRLIPVTASEPAFSFSRDRALLRQTKQQLASTGIEVLDAELFRLTPDCDTSKFSVDLDVCAELGVRHVIAQAPDELASRAAENFGALCDLAKQRGLEVDLEFVTWTETATLDRAAQIVRLANRDNGGILVDTLHFARSHCSVTSLARLPQHWFRYAQVCDAPREEPTTDEGLIFAARNDRLFLGEGGLRIREILDALPKDIWLSLEIPRALMTQQSGIETVARLALQTARHFLEESDPLQRTRASPSEHVRSR